MEKRDLCVKISLGLHFASLIGFYIGLRNFYTYITPNRYSSEFTTSIELLFLTTNFLLCFSVFLWLASLIVLFVLFVLSWKKTPSKKESSSSSEETKK